MDRLDRIISVRHNSIVSASIDGKHVIKTHPRFSRGTLMEIGIMCQISHPNLLSSTHFETTPETGFHLTMPRGTGTLYDQINRKRSGGDVEPSISESHNEIILSQIATGLHHLHSLGIAHLDLKSENIICFSDGTYRITDYETAEYLLDREQIEISSLKCTCGYRPPEGYLDESLSLPSTIVSRAFDIWSFGMIAFELYSGKPVHRADGFPRYRKQRNQDYEDEMYEWTRSEEFQEIVRSVLPQRYWDCLQVDPSKRPAIQTFLVDPPPPHLRESQPVSISLDASLVLVETISLLRSIYPDYSLTYQASVERLISEAERKLGPLNRIQLEEIVTLAHYFLDERYAIALCIYHRNRTPSANHLRKMVFRQLLEAVEGRYVFF